jgi:hypothetical protein
MESYNGWTNRETWAAHLWLTNDEYVYNSLTETLAGITDRYSRGDEIKETLSEFQNMAAEGELQAVQMLLDIGSLWRVNYQEIADALSETIKEIGG